MTDKEVLERLQDILFPKEKTVNDHSSRGQDYTIDSSVDGNLEAVITTLEAQNADKTCLSSLAAIMINLIAARTLLKSQLNQE